MMERRKQLPFLRRTSSRPLWQSALLYAIVTFWCLIVLFPFYWLATTSVKRPIDVSRGPNYIPFVDFQPIPDHWEEMFGCAAGINREAFPQQPRVGGR